MALNPDALEGRAPSSSSSNNPSSLDLIVGGGSGSSVTRRNEEDDGRSVGLAGNDDNGGGDGAVFSSFVAASRSSHGIVGGGVSNSSSSSSSSSSFAAPPGLEAVPSPVSASSSSLLDDDEEVTIADQRGRSPSSSSSSSSSTEDDNDDNSRFERLASRRRARERLTRSDSREDEDRERNEEQQQQQPQPQEEQQEHSENAGSESDNDDEEEEDESDDDEEKETNNENNIRKWVQQVEHNAAIAKENCCQRDVPAALTEALREIAKCADQTKEGRQAVAAAGGVPLLLNVFKAYPHDPTTMTQVCNIVTYLARDMAILAILTQHGAIMAVSNVMERHLGSSSVELQASACNALNNLAMNEANRRTIAAPEAAHAIPKILQALQTHTDHTVLQANGLNCLWNLAIFPGNRIPIARAGGIAQILDALKRHFSRLTSLVAEGCGALWNLADESALQQEIVQRGGIELICQAIEYHNNHNTNSVDVLNMQRLCFGALERLIRDNDWGRVSLLRYGHPQQQESASDQGYKGIRMVLESMRKHPDEDDIQSAGCGILRNLAAGDFSKLSLAQPFAASLMEQGAAPLVLEALRKHRGCSKIQNRASQCILNLTYHGPSQQSLRESGAASEIENAILSQRSSDSSVFATALMAHSELTRSSKTGLKQERALAA